MGSDAAIITGARRFFEELGLGINSSVVLNSGYPPEYISLPPKEILQYILSLVFHPIIKNQVNKYINR